MPGIFPVKTEYINLGLGLPTEEFYREGMLEKFKSRVKGTHKVKFNHPVFNDAEITLIVKDVAAIPEGSAAMINQLYDSDGAVIEEKSELARRLTLTVDIGAITTDISAVENNRSVGAMCFGIEKGMYHALDEVIEDIAKDYGGYRLSRHRLMQYLTLEGGKIPYKKQTIDGTAYARYRYGQLAEDISRKVVNRLNREKPNIQDKVYTTLFTNY